MDVIKHAADTLAALSHSCQADGVVERTIAMAACGSLTALLTHAKAQAAELERLKEPLGDAEEVDGARKAFAKWDINSYIDSLTVASHVEGLLSYIERQAAALTMRDDREKGAVGDVLAERERQKSVEGWTAEHDDEHRNGEIAAAAAAYAFSAATEGHYYAADPLGFWPWDVKWWKPKGARRDLVRAGALILAEIERLDREEARALTVGWDGGQ